jgi:CcmD family protein
MEPIYVVLIINLIVWTGIFLYTLYLNKSISDLKAKLKRLGNKDTN